jgi:hypothetical protein
MARDFFHATSLWFGTVLSRDSRLTGMPLPPRKAIVV